MVKLLAALLCTIKAFDPSVRPKCYVTGQAVVGWNQINSPGFPSPFPGKLDCLYAITAPPGAKIELEFDNFNMASSPGCKKQGLAILDPAQSKVPGQTTIVCGPTKPETFKTKGNKVFLHLSSNIRGASDGEFLVKYRIKQKGMDMSGPGGSPGGGGPPMGVFGPLDQGPPAAVGGGGGGAGPRRAKAPKKAPKAKGGKPNVKQMIAKMAEASDRTGQRGGNAIGKNKMAGGNNSQAHMRGHCQDGWMPGMPCMQKKTKELGSKSDLQTKKLLKYLGMGVGIAGACVVVWLMFRHFTGKTNGGIPEPENALPEGKVPTHLAAIAEHKEKMKAQGKEYPEDSD